MSWTTFVNSTTIDANEMNNNFYWCAQGSLMPLGGTNMEYTDSVYDLGSATYKWNNIYCNNLNISGSITINNNQITLLSSQIILSAAANSIEFTGLNGDVDIFYNLKIYGKCDNTSTNLYMYFNNDSTTANYYRTICGLQSATTYVESNTTPTLHFTNGVNLTTTSLINIFLYLKSGTYRYSINRYSFGIELAGIGPAHSFSGNVWKNSASTITSIKLVNQGNWLTGSIFQLWRI